MNNKSVLSSTNPDVEHFNQWALTYDKSILQRWLFRPVQTKIVDLLLQEWHEKPPNCILDVGCGTGRFLRIASVQWPQAKLIGVDPAKQMISEAARLNPNATFKIAYAESLPLADNAADIVISSLSFHHWADQKKGIQEIARVLSRNGLFCLADQNFPLSKIFRERIRNRKEIRELMLEAGLTVRRQQGLGLRFVHITLAQKYTPNASI